jgi:hypothetical protein
MRDVSQRRELDDKDPPEIRRLHGNSPPSGRVRRLRSCPP